jgi:hypothetical protein
VELKEQENESKITTQSPSKLLGLICTFLAYAILVFGVVKGINKGSRFQKPKSVTNEDIYKKLEGLEDKVESGTHIQKFGIIYAIGVAFIILGLSLLPAFLQSTGIDMKSFYRINISGLLAVGTFALVYALSRKRGKRQQKQ